LQSPTKEARASSPLKEMVEAKPSSTEKAENRIDSEKERDAGEKLP
jgi:hypothetical protein